MNNTPTPRTDNHYKSMQTNTQSTEGKDPQQTTGESSLDGAACSPSDTIAFVRRFNGWRRGNIILDESEYKRITGALDAVCDLAERYRNTLEDIYTGHILRGAVQEEIEEALKFNMENS